MCRASKMCTCIDEKLNSSTGAFVLGIGLRCCHRRISQVLASPAVFIDFLLFFCPSGDFLWINKKLWIQRFAWYTGGSLAYTMHRMYESVDANSQLRCKALVPRCKSDASKDNFTMHDGLPPLDLRNLIRCQETWLSKILDTDLSQEGFEEDGVRAKDDKC